MPFVYYSPEEQKKMAGIYAECGGNGSAIPAALRRIKEELGITLPEEGRSLRNWQKRYNIYPVIKKAEPVLFEMEAKDQLGSIIPRLMSMEEFENMQQLYAGAAKLQDDKLLIAIYKELLSEKKRKSIKAMSMIELLQIKRIIEESQQKRDNHMIRLKDYVDFKKRSIPVDYNKYDKEILGDLDKAMEDKQ